MRGAAAKAEVMGTPSRGYLNDPANDEAEGGRETPEPPGDPLPLSPLQIGTKERQKHTVSNKLRANM